MSVASVAYIAFFAAPSHRLGLALMTSLIAASGVLALFVVPWARIVASPRRERAFLLWGVFSVLMVLAMTLLDGGGESPLQLALFLPVVFASLSFPLRNLVILAVLAEVTFLALALHGGFDGGYVLVFCALLAGTATMALWQAKIHDGWRQELARSSTTDPLTHLLNRRGFAMAAERAFGALDRRRRPVTLVVIDLDCLKSYNDEHGHQAGDELLCWVAERLSSALRADDAVARLGGDEFAVLLPGTSAAAATSVVAQLSAALAKRAPHCLGTASAPEQGTSFDALYRSADAALYQRKLLRGQRGERSQQTVPDRSPAPG
jgi:diguanylate cyclase (GGDEF)-like protein